MVVFGWEPSPRRRRLARGEGLHEEGEPDAGGDQTGEPLGLGPDAEEWPARMRDEPAREGEERNAQPLRAGRAQVRRQGRDFSALKTLWVWKIFRAGKYIPSQLRIRARGVERLTRFGGLTYSRAVPSETAAVGRRLFSDV